MPVNWTRTKLADIATILGGGTPRRADAAYFCVVLPWVTPTDLAPIGKIVTLGAVAGEGVQTGGNDDRWVFDVEAVLDTDPEDVIRTHEGAWIVSADVTRSGTQTPATPDGDLRWLFKKTTGVSRFEREYDTKDAALGCKDGWFGRDGMDD